MICHLLQGVFAASLTSTLFFFLIMSSRKLVAKFIGAQWNYYIWFSIFIPWLVIWFPCSFFVTFAVLRIYTFIKPLLSSQLTHSTIFTKIYFVMMNGVGYTFNISKIFFICWILGVIVSLLYVVFRHLRYIQLLRKNSRKLKKQEKNKISQSIIIKEALLSRIFISTFITSPMLCNVIKPRIYLPVNFFSSYTTLEKKYVLQHELCHLHRHDVLANAILLLLVCLNWFNPLMFLTYRYFRSAQELACDAVVCKQFSPTEKKDYGFALLKTVINPTSEAPISCWWNIGIELKERCLMLKFHHSKPIKTIMGMIILISIYFTGIAATSLENRDSLFVYSIFSARGSDFVIKLFNNTSITLPLTYSITSPDQDAVTGQLFRGDGNGEFITINSALKEKSIAEITIKMTGHIIWKGIVTFSEFNSESNIKTIYLDTNFQIGTHFFKNIHVISFDILEKNIK